jgi:hypothetical protein
MDGKDKQIFDIMASVQFGLEQRGYRVYGTFLHGSQNYGLDLYTHEYMSDIDLKCFIIPDFEALFYNRLISTTEDNGFGGHVEIKDIRLLPATLAKGNAAYLECLYTKWQLYEDRRIIDMRDRIVSERFPLVIKALYGMAANKVTDMRHPFPTKEGIIAKFGYDPKQLSHLARIYYLAKDMIENGKTMGEALYPDEQTRRYLLDLKLGKIPNDQVDSLSGVFLDKMRAYANVYGSKEKCAALNSDIENEIRIIVAGVVKANLGLK